VVLWWKARRKEFASKGAGAKWAGKERETTTGRENREGGNGHLDGVNGEENLGTEEAKKKRNEKTQKEDERSPWG